MTMIEGTVLGTCPVGQLQGRHIENKAISAGSVVDYGLIVGDLEGVRPDSMSPFTEGIYPYGISRADIAVDENKVPVCTNVFLFRNNQAVAVKTEDASVVIHSPIFATELGLATQTVAAGYEIGVCVSDVMSDGIGFSESGLSYVLVELYDTPVLVSGGTEPIARQEGGV